MAAFQSGELATGALINPFRAFTVAIPYFVIWPLVWHKKTEGYDGKAVRYSSFQGFSLISQVISAGVGSAIERLAKVGRQTVLPETCDESPRCLSA